MDVSETDFQTAVIDRSHTLPVVVDFWAEWCAPCRQLGPVLDRAAQARAGKLELAKLDVDANPGISQQYGIQGIPAVKAFRQGQVVSEFVGAQPPQEVERFMDELLPSEADALVAQGDEASLRQAVELAPGRADAAVPLARIWHSRREDEQALALLRSVPGSFAADGLVARIELERRAATPAAEERTDGNADAVQEAFAAIDAGDQPHALDLLLEALARAAAAEAAADADVQNEIRRVIVGVLDELGVESPLARDARRRLAQALY